MEVYTMREYKVSLDNPSLFCCYHGDRQMSDLSCCNLLQPVFQNRVTRAVTL